MPLHTPGRILLALWWITVVVLMNAFTGHMKATMMLKPDPVRIDSFKDLVLRGNVRPFLWRNSAYADLLKNAFDVQEYRDVWSLIVALDGLRDSETLYDVAHLREVLVGKAVLISDYTTTLYYASRTCRQRLAPGNYYFAKERNFQTKVAMGMRKDMDPALMQLINKR
ncbi:hypothetical protein HPB48_016296 [Haemaphysalis longicornis]|uniref:Ionotropic receptor n=1 Tax=Haemaphysalis longicornis TaxID=44386 RepID=A0A9J6GC96_HAELO|nr:hypothetical protein HPB48_016296 [Haemaphysalis longicornis]